MIKWSDVGTILFCVLYLALLLLLMFAANRDYWLLMGASLTGFLIATIILAGRAIARHISDHTKRLERLISESQDNKTTNENPA